MSIYFYSYLIYTISKEFEADKEKVDELCGRPLLFFIVDKILHECNVLGVDINIRVLEVFRKKIYTLKMAQTRANKRGGKCANALLEQCGRQVHIV